MFLPFYLNCDLVLWLSPPFTSKLVIENSIHMLVVTLSLHALHGANEVRVEVVINKLL
jgi:hypothetical protein